MNQCKSSRFLFLFFHLFVLIDCTYPGSRFKDEVTEYYYGSDDNRHTPVSKPSFHHHLETLDDRYGRTHNKGKIDIYIYIFHQIFSYIFNR